MNVGREKSYILSILYTADLNLSLSWLMGLVGYGSLLYTSQGWVTLKLLAASPRQLEVLGVFRLTVIGLELLGYGIKEP
jgi:hypothetical protein